FVPTTAINNNTAPWLPSTSPTSPVCPPSTSLAVAPTSASVPGAPSPAVCASCPVAMLAAYRSRPTWITARCSSCPPSTSRTSPLRPAPTPSVPRSASEPGAASRRGRVAGAVASLVTCRSRACATRVPSSSSPTRNAAGPPCSSRARPTCPEAGRTSATGGWDRSSTGSSRLGEGRCRSRRPSRAGWSCCGTRADRRRTSTAAAGPATSSPACPSSLAACRS
ncbi:unnamed protein product, partial [Ectocarpus fasciculatus]